MSKVFLYVHVHLVCSFDYDCGDLSLEKGNINSVVRLPVRNITLLNELRVAQQWIRVAYPCLDVTIVVAEAWIQYQVDYFT